MCVCLYMFGDFDINGNYSLLLLKIDQTESANMLSLAWKAHPALRLAMALLKLFKEHFISILIL